MLTFSLALKSGSRAQGEERMTRRAIKTHTSALGRHRRDVASRAHRHPIPSPCDRAHQPDPRPRGVGAELTRHRQCPRQESNLDLPLRRRKRPGFDMPQSVSVFGPCSPARRHGDWSRFGQIPLRLGNRSGLLPERALGSPSSKTSSAAGSGDPSLLHDRRPMTARSGRVDRGLVSVFAARRQTLSS